ncbi:MAG: Exodeoxyribonuclease 7 small subunit [Firmicutes bacterium ADurb.Bin182]|nr:MAG: Exodeoxyribonuclease 7 small subunit [Firmicutes bacterium ADurb.Bin182]
MSDKSELTFEQAMEKLEETVNKLLVSGIPLEEMITLYEKGVQLSKQCMKQLDEYEARIDILSTGGKKTMPADC